MKGWQVAGGNKGAVLKRAGWAGLGAIFLAALSLVWVPPALAGADLPLFGPVNFDRHQGAPTIYTETFRRCEPSDRALLQIWNGDGKATRITAAQILINGVEIFGESAFKQQDDYLEAPIPAAKVNDLKVVLKSGDFKEPAFLRIGILGKNCDATPPVISSPEPADGALLATATPHIAAAFSDEAGGAGIDPASVRLTLDGADVSAAASHSASGIGYDPPPLGEGKHRVELAVADLAGNRATLSWNFVTDTVPPHFAVTSQQEGAWLNTPTVTVAGSLDDPPARVTVNGVAATVSGDGFALDGVALAEGVNTLTVVATDPAGNTAAQSINVHLDTVPPKVAIAAPADGLLTNVPQADVAAGVDEPVLAAAVNDQPAVVDGQSLRLAGVELSEGDNLLTVTARDRAGNTGTATITVRLDTLPPAPPALDPLPGPTNRAPVTVSGSAEAGSTVKVFQVKPDGATTPVGSARADAGGRFSLAGPSLVEGSNRFFATATDAAGNEGSPGAAVAVVLDTVPPLLTIAAPADRSFTNQGNVSVSGSADEPLATVEVNGHAAAVTSAEFSLAALPLAEGANTLTVSATDPAGNRSSAELTVTLDSVPPTVTITAPPANLLTNRDRVAVAASVDEPVLTATVNGLPAVVDGLNLSLGELPLAEGSNVVRIAVTDRAGNPGTAEVPITRDSTPPPPPVFDAVASPTNLGSASLRGSVEAEALVRITREAADGTAAAVGLVAADASGRFVLPEVPLTEGENVFTAVATDAAGNQGEPGSDLAIVLDTVPPTILLGAPADGLFTNAATLAVTGSVDEPIAALTVNGLAASLDGRNFRREGLELLEGSNQVVVTATDLAGNSASVARTVTRDTVPPVVSIIAPLDGLLTSLGQVTVSGSVDEPIVAMTLNGAAVPFSGEDFSLADLPLVENDNLLTVAATDRAGNVGTAGVTVRRDSTPPPAPQLDPVASPTNVATTVLSGHAEAGAGVALSVLHADGGSELLGTQNAGADGAFRFAGVALAEGASSFSAVATDAAGNAGEPATASVVLDTVAPVITVTSPADGSVSDLLDIVVTGSVDEADATLTIDGVAVPLDGSAFSRPLTLQPDSNTLILLATDPAGNTGTASVTVQADGTPPTVTISAPLPGTLTSQDTLTVSGGVDEEIVALSLNGQPFAVTGSSFSLPASLVEGENLLTVAATDRAGNVGTAAVTVTRDSLPPQLTLDGPASAAAGATVTLHLAAADASPLSLVELRSAGTVVWSGGGTGATLDQDIPFSLPPALKAGEQLTLSAAAIDAAGNRSEAQLVVTVASAASGPGYLRGEVYDDSRGLLLDQAAVSVLSGDAEVAAAVTSLDGSYFFELPAGDYLLRLSKAGFTAVERAVSVQPALNLQVRDARLTPDSGAVQRLDAAGGTLRRPLTGAADGPALELTVPADAVTEAVDLRLLPLSNQGLAVPLPLGWAPLAAWQIEAFQPDTTEPAQNAATCLPRATLGAPLPAHFDLPAAPRLLLARYDGASRAWLAAGTVVVNSDATGLVAGLTGAGQYVLLLADATAAAPPAATLPGSALLGFDTATVSAVGRVVPYAAPPRQGLLAAGEVTLAENVPGTLLSGTLLTARVTERFDLASGETLQPAGYEQDLSFFRAPCVTNLGGGLLDAAPAALRTTFPVSPSRDFTVVDLLQGKVGIDILPPDTGGDGVMVGPEGARLIDGDGNVLEIPAGALAATVPVQSRTLAADSARVLVGADFTLLRAVEVDFARQALNLPATLSIPAPEGLDPTLPLVLARQIEVAGAARLKLVGSAALSGSMVVSAAELHAGASTLILPGIAASGRYFLLQAKAPLSYLCGAVAGSAGAPFAGALVSTNTSSLVDLTAAAGRYLVPLAVAPFTATALDPARQDRGSGSGQVTAAGNLLDLDLAIAAVPPRVVGVEPAAGATGVAPNVAPQVTFSEPLDRASVDSAAFRLVDAAGQDVPGTLSFNPDGSEVTFYPAASLASEASYTLSVAGTVRDLQGYPLGQPLTVPFTVRDTTPPAMPPAGAITATFPDADGLITVTGSQGSVELGASVLVINDTSGEIVGVQPATNGSFTARIAAQLGDEIQVVMMDEAGNQTLISYLTIKSDDGRYLVTAKGGKVEGEGGSQLVIPDGALLGPAVVKVTQIAQEDLPHPVPDKMKFIGAFHIDTGGLPFAKEIDLSMPLPANYPEGAFPLLVRPTTLTQADGTVEEVFEVIDTAKVENGRIVTACWPFEGILDGGDYVFLYPDLNLDAGGAIIVDGWTYQDQNGVEGFQPGADTPVVGAVVRCPQVNEVVTYSRSNGFYAMFGFAPLAQSRTFSVTAVHPQTMNRVTQTQTINQGPYIVHNLNFKLADKDTKLPDPKPPEVDVEIRPASANDNINFGYVTEGTELSFEVIAHDEAMKEVTVSGTFSDTNGGTANFAATAALTKPKELYRTSKEVDGVLLPALYTFTYKLSFAGDLAGTDGNFKAARPGIYSFTIEAVDEDGNKTIRRREVQVLTTGGTPSGQPGPPRVVRFLPEDGKTELPINTTMRIYFSEPIDPATLSSKSVQLIDQTDPDKNRVQTYLYTGIDNGQLYVTVQPQGNLKYGNDYLLRVTTAITDLAASNLPDENDVRKAVSLAEEKSIIFRTKEPQLYSPKEENRFNDGREVALYRNGEKVYAFVAAGTSGLELLDVTNPTAPRLIDTLSQTNANVSWEIRGVAVDANQGLLCVTENIRWADGNHYGYLRVYNARSLILAASDLQLSSAEKAEYRRPVGKAQLAEAFSGVPGRLVLRQGYAYIANTGAGVQVVDLGKAVSADAAVNPLVGGFSTSGQGYGIPLNLVLGKGDQLFVSTGSGKLLLLDIKTPAMPMIISEFTCGGGIVDLDYAPDYKYIDDQQQVAYLDLVLAATRTGQLYTIDYSDLRAPKLLAPVLDDNGQPAIAYVRDLAVSSATGTAVANSFNSFVIIDLRNPFNPRLLQAITMEGEEVLGGLNGMILSNGWVYLAGDQTGLRTVNLDQATIVPEPRFIVVNSDGSLYRKAGDADAGKLRYTIKPAGYQPDKVELIIYKQTADQQVTEVARNRDLLVTDNINSIVIPDNFMPAASAVGGGDNSGLYYGEVVIGDGSPAAIRSEKIPIIKQAVLIPDYNRDRIINGDDRKDAEAGKTFYFWVNDDDDQGETSGTDIPGSTIPWTETTADGSSNDRVHNYENDVVDGVRDLVDFFPVQLDLKDLLKLYPSDRYSYRLTTGGEHLNFVFTKFTGAQAGNYLTGDFQNQVDGHNDLTEAKILGHVSTHLIEAGGTGLFSTPGGGEYLNRLKSDDQNVILLEGRALLQGPLALEISDGVNEPLRLELNLSIAPVEQMFRHINLINFGSDDYLPPIHDWKGGEPDRISGDQFEFQFGKEGREHFEGFDTTLKDENFVFLHGYNVNGQQARGWQSEMFKRLFWSGSKSKFWGVSWYGSDSQVGPATPDFHINVQHALRTAPELNRQLTQTIIGTKDIAAHSLGNMVVNSALVENGPVPGIRNVFMIDAAVPLEAYTGDLVNGGDPEPSGVDEAYDPVASPDAVYSDANPMILPDWYNYAKKLGAAEWYQHFKGDTSIGGGEDQRSKLTFRDRFGSFSGATYYNFYSKGEEVLGIHRGGIKIAGDVKDLLMDGGRNAWALQEKAKGFLSFNYGGSDYGGWAFASPYVVTTPTGTISYSNNTTPLATANLLAPDELKVQPFFKLGQASPLVGPDGSGWAEAHRIQLLAEAIPATTVAMGGAGGKTVNPEIIATKRNLDMQNTFANGWPQERIDKGDMRWKHSDIRNVSYLYNYKIFEKLANPTGVKP
jgi:hypothetical protein